MTKFWNLAIPVAVVALAATAITWQVFKGKTAERKLDERVKSCRASAEQGDAQGEYCLGYLYHQGQGMLQDDAEALRWYRKAADQGYAKAQVGLGSLYYYGNGVPIDYGESLRWYRKAADQGDAVGQGAIGTIYYYGHGAMQDRAEAARWYRLAADKGFARAEYDLALLYYYGNGVAQDHSEAYRWFRKAADGGDESAQRFMRQYPAGWKNLWFGTIVAQCIFAALLLIEGLRRRYRFGSSPPSILLYANLNGLLSGGLGLFLFTHLELRENLATFVALSVTRWLLGGLWIAFLVLDFRRAKRGLTYVSNPARDSASS
jgi:TPR repeat protein